MGKSILIFDFDYLNPAQVKHLQKSEVKPFLEDKPGSSTPSVLDMDIDMDMDNWIWHVLTP